MPERSEWLEVLEGLDGPIAALRLLLNDYGKRLTALEELARVEQGIRRTTERRVFERLDALERLARLRYPYVDERPEETEERDMESFVRARKAYIERLQEETLTTKRREPEPAIYACPICRRECRGQRYHECEEPAKPLELLEWSDGGKGLWIMDADEKGCLIKFSTKGHFLIGGASTPAKLTRDHVRSLLPHLVRFAETGRLAEEGFPSPPQTCPGFAPGSTESEETSDAR